MASLAIVRKHRLPHRKAKDAAQKVADDLRSRFDLQYRWRGDDIEFSRSGLRGVLHVGAAGFTLFLERTEAWGLLRTVMSGSYPDALDLQTLLGTPAAEAPVGAIVARDRICQCPPGPLVTGWLHSGRVATRRPRSRRTRASRRSR